MNESQARNLRWELASDAAQVHSLLEDSDAEQAIRYGIPAPRRNFSTTEYRVKSGEVHVAFLGEEAVGSFTLSALPPFELEADVFGPADNPRYLSRLCVASQQLRDGSLVGLRCLREAIAAAGRLGADALRSQANPDFADVVAMLELHGFQRRGVVMEHGPYRAVNMEKPLTARSGPPAVSAD